MTHNILVNAYCIAPDRIVAGTAGSYGLERMALTFSEEWKDVAKTVTFYPPKSRPVSVVLADGDEFDIPHEATAKSGEISFTVLGYRDGKRIFSVTGEMLVLATKNKEGVPSEEPTPSEKEQILAYVQDVKEMIDAGKIKGEDGYTPIKGVDYFDGKDGYTPIKGVDYFDGHDGYTPVKGVDYFDGKDGRDGQDGKDGINGKDGTSVAIDSITESDEDGGENVVTFSDGKTLTVKNGSKGSKGDKGDAYALTTSDKTEIAEQAVELISDMPDYVITESESVIDRVISAQGNRTFTFAAITDMHYGNNGYTDGVKHACQALKYIDERIKLDAVAVLGDYTDGMATTNNEGAISDLKAVNSILSDLRFAPNFRMQGNHDFYESHSPTVSRYIQAYSAGVVWGDRLGGYFYRDFEEFKLRVIAVNGNEVYGDYLHCTDEQYNWFIDSLDLSAKETAEDWQILILSHYPLDWFAYNNAYCFWAILNAYQNGGAWNNSTGTISCDFANKNAAKIIGNIHGHIHNLLVRNIAAGQPNTTEATIDVKRIATPEACFGRANSYNGDWEYNPFGEETSYPKTQGTAEDTAFCIYCIDLDTYTINAVCYGAGYDRQITYGDAPIEIKNWKNYGIDTSGNLYDGKGYKEDYRLNSSGVESSFSGMDVTGYIPIKAGDVIRISGAAAGGNTAYFHYYDSSFAWISKATEDGYEGETPNLTITVKNQNAAYFRMTAKLDDAIITINQPIE
jgi:hypothetical protein